MHMNSPLTLRDSTGNGVSGTPASLDILSRAFPRHSPVVLELVLKGCSGNVVHAIEVVTQCSVTPPTPVASPLTVPNVTPQHLPETSPQIPPTSQPNSFPYSSPMVRFNLLNGQYKFMPPMLPLMLPGASNGWGSYPMPFQVPSVNQLHGNGFRPVEEESEMNAIESRTKESSDPDRVDVDDASNHVPSHVSNGLPGNNVNIPMKCRDCGKAINFDDRFCTNCPQTGQ